MHLASYPQSDASLVDDDLDLTMRLVREAVVMGRALRSKFTIKTRQPLNECTVIIRDAAKLGLVRRMEALIREELNVKKVVFDTAEERVVSISAKANFKKLGKLLGPKMKEAAAAIERFTSNMIHALEQGGTIDVAGRAVAFDDIEIRRTKHEGIEVETASDMTVALDTTLTDELKNEGLAREFINRVQNLRKDAALNVTDRIRITYTTDSPVMTDALRRYRDYVTSETLAVELLPGAIAPSMKREACVIDEIKVTVGIEKAG